MGIFCWNNVVTDAFVNLWTDNSAAPNCLLYTESGWVVESISKDVLIPCKAVTVDVVYNRYFTWDGWYDWITTGFSSLAFFLVLHVLYCSILYRIRFSYVFLTLSFPVFLCLVFGIFLQHKNVYRGAQICHSCYFEYIMLNIILHDLLLVKFNLKSREII